MKGRIKGIILIVLGIVIAFPLFSTTYFVMVETSTPEFCASCHEIQAAVDSWRTSTHANNSQGLVADCMDCHLPSPENTVEFFYVKTTHGLKDYFYHFMGDEYDREKAKQKAYLVSNNEQCQKCHGNLLHIPEKRGAMLAHRSVLYSGRDFKCVECHRDLVHNPAPVYRYKQFEATYRGFGP